MNEMSLGRHLLVLAALIVNLWLGGDVVQAALGTVARSALEFSLILGYIWIVLGIRVPLPWRRPREGDAAGERNDRR